MARNDVPAKLVAGLEGALQVDAPAGLPFAERGLGEGLVGDVDREGAASPFGLTTTAVRQAPSQAMEAPMAMPSAA